MVYIVPHSLMLKAHFTGNICVICVLYLLIHEIYPL